MSQSTWRYVIGGLFGIAFLAALLGLFFSSVNATVLTTVMVLMAGALVLVSMLPQVSELGLQALLAEHLR